MVSEIEFQMDPAICKSGQGKNPEFPGVVSFEAKNCFTPPRRTVRMRRMESHVTSRARSNEWYQRPGFFACRHGGTGSAISEKIRACDPPGGVWNPVSQADAT
jgi:hypothetical protein